MNEFLRRTRKLEQKTAASTSNNRNMDWLKSLFSYIRTDAEPPPDSFLRAGGNLEKTFFKEGI